MAMFSVLKFEGPPNTLVWKWPADNLTTASQLVVNQSQEAVFFSGGQALDVLGPGTHTLQTKNIPLLQKLVNLPFGGESPFKAEVFFVNRVSKLDYKWGSPTPFLVQDPKFQVTVSVGCFGQFGMQVEDSRTFVTQIVGTMPSWSGESVVEYFKGLLLTRVRSSLSEFLQRKAVSIVEVTAHLADLSKEVEAQLVPEFQRFGVRLLAFTIVSVDIPNSERERLQQGQFDNLRIQQMGANYERMRHLDIMEKAAENPGSAGTLMGGGIGLGLGVQMAQAAGVLGGGIVPPTAPAKAPLPSSAATCPKCGAALAPSAAFCGGCGSKVEIGAVCPKCQAPVPAGMKFCGQCGCPMGNPRCPKCQAENPPGMKFCGSCGSPI